MHKKNNTHIIAFVATSIDGRISLRKKTCPDWTSPEDWRFFQTSLQKMDAVVVGHNTYEAARARLKKRCTYVLSRSRTRTYRAGSVTFINPDSVDMDEILRHHRSVAVLGGASVYGMFFDRNLVDELYVTIEPLIFGRGVPMVKDCTKTAHLSLCCIKKLNHSGTVLMHYKKL
ncbi:MAG: dihydrofolate reductase [Candidatus Uhrbacteria bacterium]|nr:dihydrofolate reductase [Candidatus Uhrbacteria bacterium]